MLSERPPLATSNSPTFGQSNSPRQDRLIISQLWEFAKRVQSHVDMLNEAVERIKARVHKVTSLKLIVNEKGVALTAFALRSRFDNARDAAALKATDPKLLARIRDFQFRDLRAKAGTDKEDSGGMGEAKDLLGHADEKMTKRYVRHRIGKRVSPTR